MSVEILIKNFSNFWIDIVSKSNLTDHQIFVFGTCLLNITLFWGYNSILFICYSLRLFPQYLTQGNLPTNTELVLLNIRDYLITQLIGLPIISYSLFKIFVYFGMSVREPLPKITIILRDLLIAVFVADFMGYWTHRAMHHKSIYKYIHKQHHKYKVNIGIAAVYAHPVEDLSNTVSSISGCLFMGSHILVFWLWLSIRLLEAVNAHSGYHFLPLKYTSWLSGGAFHEYHHSHNVGNYGQFTTFWDWLFGTDVSYNEYQRKKREKEGLRELKGDGDKVVSNDALSSLHTNSSTITTSDESTTFVNVISSVKSKSDKITNGVVNEVSKVATVTPTSSVKSTDTCTVSRGLKSRGKKGQ